MPQLKLVENADSVQYSKNINNFGEQTLTNSNLKFTLCDLTDYSVRPFGNLFTSFNLPITQTQKDSFNATYVNTAFNYFSDITKIVVAEIPQNTYGELIDGKTFSIKIPQISGSTFSAINCYASYFLKSELDVDTNVLNSQYSDANINSGYFGITPSASNANNSNIAYLFSDNIAKPKVNYSYSIGLDTASYNMVSSRTTVSNVYLYRSSTSPINFNFEVGKQYKITLTNIKRYDQAYSVTFNDGILEAYFSNEDSLGLTSANGVNLTLDNNGRGVRSFNYSPTLTSNTLTIKSLNNASPNRLIIDVSVKIEELVVEEGTWSRWTQGNKFIPNLSSVNGKQPARFSDTNNILIDRPIGILYLDKGFAVFTDRNIVDNFYYSGATSGVTSNSDPNFTQIYFDSSLASATFNSIYSEYVQSVMCMAMPNEFYTSNNPTFTEVYGTNGVNNTGNDPVYITEIGLYNQYGELIAIAKTSEPIAKNKANMVAFNIDLKL
jgi:hypothetical protein